MRTINSKGWLIAILLALIPILAIAAQPKVKTNSTPAKPDFAYPKTVIANSEAALTRALKAGNEKEALRALINIEMAQTMVTSDSTPQAIEMIASTTERFTSPAMRALGSLLVADIYSSIYDQDRWTYNQRQISAEPLPANCFLWSGAQFRKVILSYVDRALAEAPVLKEAKLADYPSLITCEKDSRIYYPTLYDFVATRAIQYLNNFNDINNVIARGNIRPWEPGVKFAVTQPAIEKTLELYDALLELHRSTPAPEVNYQIERLQYISQHTYDSYSTANRQAFTDAMTALYGQWQQSEWGGNVLIGMHNLDIDVDDAWLYAAIQSQIKRYPAYIYNVQLQNIVKELAEPSVKVSFPKYSALGRDVDLKVDMENCNAVDLEVYEVSRLVELGNRWSRSVAVTAARRHGRLVTTLHVKADGQVPFQEQTTLTLRLPAFGAYAVIAAAGSDVAPRLSDEVEVIGCSNLGLFSFAIDAPTVVAINPLTGAPEADVEIIECERRNAAHTRVATTDGDGFAPLAKGNLNLLPKKGSDRFGKPVYVYSLNRRDDREKERMAVDGFTDLAVYHPGDTVRFFAVVYSYGKQGRSVKAAEQVRVAMMDVNYQQVDTLRATTDDFGRITGEFRIPTDGLTGCFNLQVSKLAHGGGDLGDISFMVSDYKLPEYSLTLEPAQQGVPAQGDVTVTGRAMTYSGFPLADCAVHAVVSVGRRSIWWWSSENPVDFYTADLTTGADGRFTLELPASLLASSPLPQGFYTVKITATSPAGESHDASVTFTPSKAYKIEASIDKVINRDNPAKLTLRLYDGKNQPAVEPINVELVSDADSLTAWRQQLNPGEQQLDLRSVGSGTFTLIAAPVGYEADTVKVRNIVIYSPSDSKSPVSALLWTPITTLTTDGTQRAELLLATTAERSHLLQIISADGRIVSRQWKEYPAGMHRVAIDLPKDVKKAKVEYVTTFGFKSQSLEIDVDASVHKPKLNIEIESMRDKLTPGAEERWTIRVSNAAGDAAAAAVVTRMYNQALDAIYESEWELHLRSIGVPQLNVSGLGFNQVSSGIFAPRSSNGKTWLDISNPDWETYGYSLYPYRGGRTRGIYGYRSASKMNSLMLESAESDEVVVEEAEEVQSDIVNVHEFKEKLSSSVLPAMGVATADAGDAEEAGEAGEAAVADSSEPELGYREAEVPIAFFRPTLTTGADGTTTLEFTVPNANTTWVLNLLAYTRELEIGTKAAELVANKPVMVAANLPRFVRLGDRMAVNAMVMNNSDTVQTIATSVELFNPADGAVIASRSFEQTLEPQASATAAIEFDATFGPLVGYRVRSSAGGYSDGEQALIGVLPSMTEVVESTTFYLPSDSSQLAMRLPQMPADARVTLQMCENPLWYVVTALPGLSQAEMSTPVDAAGAIFSSAIAAGLLHDNPQIGEAIRQWRQSDRSESALTSMLERNSDLKILLLQATPWMLSAKNDTERMTRLALLFDRKQVEGTQAAAIALLRKLATDQGGWRWIGECQEPSLWATEQALSLFGHLQWLGYMPADKELQSLVDNAIAYADGEEAKLFARYPDASYLPYVFMRNRLTSRKLTSAIERMTETTVQRAIAGWKKYGLFDKGVAAIILADRGNKMVARQIIESLSQFAETSPAKGMWWPSLKDTWWRSYNDLGITALLLEAYDRVMPGSPEVERISQWLILQKEARDWGSSFPTTTVIADLLRTSGRWLVPAQGVGVTLNGQAVEANPTDRYTGNFRTDLSPLHPSGAELRIDKPAATPAWGSVMSAYSEPMADVRAAACDAVTIEKRLYRQTSDATATQWSGDLSELKVGDRVRTELTIVSSRDIDYVAIVDDRAAGFEPVEQLPRPLWSEGICFYRENRNSSTRLFITHLPKGEYRLTYDLWANNAGTFASGIATLQSQYAPQITSHSSGSVITIK